MEDQPKESGNAQNAENTKGDILAGDIPKAGDDLNDPDASKIDGSGDALKETSDEVTKLCMESEDTVDPSKATPNKASEPVPEGHDNVCSPKTVDATSDLQKPKPFDMKSLNNETELNSEDIELKWDDDEDGDNVVDDKTPGLIEKLNLIDDKISNIDDYLDKAADTTPMDVDETEKEEVLPPKALDSKIKLPEHTETAITDAKVETNSNRQTDDSDGKIDTPVASTDDVEMDSSNISSFVKESIKKELEGKVLDAETSDSVNMTEKMETDLVNDEISSTSILEHKNTNDDNIKTMIENEVNTMMSPTEINVDGAPSIDTTLLHKTSIGTLSLEGQSIPNDDPGSKTISESTVATVENLQKDMPEPFISKDIDDPSVETPVPSKAQSDDIDTTTDTAENVALSTEISENAVSISTLENPIDSSDTIKNVELVPSEVSATNVNSSVKKDSSNEKEFVDSTHTKKEIENLSPTAKDVEKCKNMGPIATLDEVKDVNNGFALQSSKTMMEPKETVTNTEPINSKEEKIEVDTAKANAANDITDTVQNTMEIDTPAPAVEPTPSTSKAEDESIEPQDIKTECPEPVKDSNPADFDPSSSNEGQLDESDEIQEMADSLGLLAESSRIMDDEEDEEEDADDDDDADADEDQDDESNLMTAEQSEDSNNAQTSETDAPKDATADIDISENSFAGKIVQKETEVAVEAEEKERDIAEKAGETETDVAEDTEADIAEEADGDIGESEIAAADDVIEDAAEAEVKDAELDVDIDDVIVEEIEIVGKPLTPVEEATPVIAAVEPVVEASDVNPPAQEGVSSVQLSELSADTSWDSISDREKNTILKRLLDKDSVAPPLKTLDLTSDTESPRQTRSTSKAEKKTEVLEPDNIVNIVDFGEISSEDDIQEVNQGQSKLDSTTTKEDPNSSVTSVNIPKDLDIISAASGNTSQIVEKDGETIIKGVPKPAPPKMARLNTSEISIKTTTASAEPNIVIPETTQNGSKAAEKSKFGLEVFSLDSDEEDEAVKENTDKPSDRGAGRCINPLCPETCRDKIVADAGTLRYYDIERKRKAMVCQDCADVVALRLQGLISGVRSSSGLLQLPMSRPEQQLVEISDSEEEEEEAPRPPPLGAAAAGFLEAHLADMINQTWHKYDLEERLLDARAEIEMELEHLEEERKEIDAMLNDCQAATDALRNELYATFTPRTQALPPIDIIDTPFAQYAALSDDDIKINQNENEVRRSKRPRPASIANKQERMSTDVKSETSTDQQFDSSSKMDDDNTDIKVVKLSAEAAPAGLPAAGELVRPALAPGQVVLAMRHAFGSWMRASVLEVSSKAQFSVCKVRFEHKVKNAVVSITARHLAYADPAPVRLTIGTRVVALFSDVSDSTKRKSFYSGVIAEMPNPVNSYRYLVFFDDGYAQYVSHGDVRVVCECSSLVWEEVHPFSREFVRQYLRAYPERPMVRLHEGQSLKTEWNGKWWISKVLKTDASLVQVYFEADNRSEWIYRGSTRLAPLYLELQAAERPRNRPLPRSTQNRGIEKQNMPYVEYTRTEEQEQNKADAQTQQQQQEEYIKRQRAVAKKSTALPTPPPKHPQPLDNVMSRVVYYTPKAAVKPLKMVPHSCGPSCRRADVLPLRELRTYNPLARPLLSGWERQIVRYKGRKEVMYRAPCGRRLRDMRELHAYLRATQSDMTVDLFHFGAGTHCLAEFLLTRCIVSKKDLSHGKENVPVPCVNYYDNSLPEFCSYNTERTPTAGVPLNLDPEFLCGCDCTDDCQDKSKCACWKLTLDGAKTIGMDDDAGYVYRRLLDPVPSGIYECNSRCKCKHTCLNRVAQHPLQLKLQVFKTQNRGWGIRALNDVPKGAFLCVYAGNLLTDATANLDGLNEGDEYLAELDYIEVVEQMKEGYEEDVPDKDKELDKNANEDSEEDESTESDSEERREKNDEQDDDFRPAYDIPQPRGPLLFNKSLRKRDKKNKKDKEGSPAAEKKKQGGDCITISDDEEVREPQRFAAQAGMGGNDFKSKHRSVRAHFGKDEACYIMDAKVQGNIGRYLNHSCQPNVFVQNVFVDTHDPRFPWVAFFALSDIRSGTELTWNYNYDVGSVPGKTLYCYCGAPNCRGRLL